MRECWINVYAPLDIEYQEYIYGEPRNSLKQAIHNSFMGSRKAIYRIHVRMK